MPAQTDTLPTIGWIGTGVMGLSMCKYIINKGHTLYVYNRTERKADELVKMGAKYCTPEDMAPIVDILILMVGYPSDVKEVVLDKDIISKMKPGTLIIDHTSSSPELAEQIGKAAESLSLYCLDAPVSGGDIGAKNGTLSIMTGGTEQSFRMAQPILELYGNNIELCGGYGCGQKTKLSNQIAVAGTMIGTCEALLFAEKAGLDLNQVVKVISGGAGMSYSMKVLGPRIVNNELGPGFYIEHFIKDLELTINECKRIGINLPGLNLVRTLYENLPPRNGAHGLIEALRKMNA